MKLSQRVIKSYHPETWTSANRYSECELVPLDSDDPEFEHVVNKIQNTLSVDIFSVERVENPFLWGMYELTKAEYRANDIRFKQKELFHCTDGSSIPSIVKNNLDWRKTKRAKFGRGVSFSPSASYADREANPKIGGYNRAMILATVIVGNCCNGFRGMKIPFDESDTSIGNKGKVYVKFCDNEFYPSYVAYYTDE